MVQQGLAAAFQAGDPVTDVLDRSDRRPVWRWPPGPGWPREAASPWLL